MTTMTTVDSHGREYLTPPEKITELIPGVLYQSGAIHDWKDIAGQAPVTAVVDLRSKGGHHPHRFPNDPRYIYVHWPIFDHMDDEAYMLPPRPTMMAVARFISDLIEAGHAVLVHCSGGRNRSSLILGLVLGIVEGVGGEEAVVWVEGDRPGTFTNRLFRDWMMLQEEGAAR